MIPTEKFFVKSGADLKKVFNSAKYIAYMVTEGDKPNQTNKRSVTNMCNLTTKFLDFWYNRTEVDFEFLFIADGIEKDKTFVAVKDINEPQLAQFIENGKREGINVFLSLVPFGYKLGTEKDISFVSNLWLDIVPNHAYFKFNERFVVNNLEDLQFIKELGEKLCPFDKVYSEDVDTIEDDVLVSIEEFTGLSDSKQKFINGVIPDLVRVLAIVLDYIEYEKLLEEVDENESSP